MYKILIWAWIHSVGADSHAAMWCNPWDEVVCDIMVAPILHCFRWIHPSALFALPPALQTFHFIRIFLQPGSWRFACLCSWLPFRMRSWHWTHACDSYIWIQFTDRCQSTMHEFHLSPWWQTASVGKEKDFNSFCLGAPCTAGILTNCWVYTGHLLSWREFPLWTNRQFPVLVIFYSSRYDVCSLCCACRGDS